MMDSIADITPVTVTSDMLLGVAEIGWANEFDLFSKANALSTSTAQVRIEGKLAYVIGTEHADISFKSGSEPRIIDNFVTNIFEKDGDRWLMISHQAQVIPR